MGRKYLTLKGTPRGTHFIWEERLKLQYYYCGRNVTIDNGSAFADVKV